MSPHSTLEGCESYEDVLVHKVTSLRSGTLTKRIDQFETVGSGIPVVVLSLNVLYLYEVVLYDILEIQLQHAWSAFYEHPPCYRWVGLN